MRILRLCLAMAALFAVGGLQAQLDNVMVYGTVKDMSSSKKLDGVTVTVFKNGAKLTEVTTGASGKYEVNLDYGADYKVMCSKSGFVGKNITIDTRNVPEEERQGGHGMNIDFTMMAEIQGVDYSVLLEPFGMANYVKASGNFEWDMEYTARMRAAQAKLLKEYEDRKKREASAEAEYAKLMKQGEDAMKAADFKKAVGSFSGALDAKPNDAIASAKLSDAQMRLNEQEGTKKLDEDYAALIKEADQLMSRKDYEASKGKYSDALKLKEEEKYPKDKIKEIDLILADLARKEEEERQAKELQARYDAAVKAADEAFNKASWDQATTKYTEASELKPSEKYPKDQLAAIVKKKEEDAQKAEEERLAKELEEKYNAAIKAADAAFSKSSWDEATTKYTEAGGLKPKEQYPKDQLAAITKKKAEEADKAEQERLARELDEKYQAVVKAGDDAFKSANWEQATTKYTEASTLKPAEQYPKDQLAAIARKKDEESKKAEEERLARELQERYDAAIAAADAAFGQEKWEDASSKYIEASTMKPAEKYPQDQLAAIRKKQDDLARKAEEEKRQRELDERYQAAIAAADQAFGKESWEEARGKYNDAAAIKPAETYPKDQLAAINQRLADAETRRKQEELDARYDAAIAKADGEFSGADYAAAKKSYQDALKVKPDESYPKERIAESEALLAELARKAEEDRKRQELEARYADLIAKADKAYDGEKWSAAMNDYKDALQLKPDESHPRSRIADIEQRMDAAAQAKAEEERLAREAAERDKRYNDLVAAADKAFSGKDYDKARKGYNEALEVKAGEKHPQDRLSEIDRILDEMADKEERDRLAAEREAAERERLAEEARLAAEMEAAERARREEEERQRMAGQAERDARYQQHIAAADAAFGSKDYDQARNRYLDALGVKPEERYPQDRIAAIEAELDKVRQAQSEAERLAAEQRRAEEERLRREAEEAEAARLAALRAKESEEEAKRRREAEEAEARRLEEERVAMQRDAARALDERYRSSVLAADEALAVKDYERARALYAEASDIKPKETYPIAKIEQIDQLLAEQQRQREEAELAAQRAAEKRSNDRPRQSSTVDMRKEQEAESFMRAAREREEAEKYDRIRKFRSELEQAEAAKADAALARRMEGVEEKRRMQEPGAGLYIGDQDGRMRNADELEAYREALAREQQARERRAAEVREGNYGDKLALQEEIAALDQQGTRMHTRSVREVEREKEAAAQAEAERAAVAAQRSQQARGDAVQLAQRTTTMEERRSTLVDHQRRAVEEEKRAQQARELRLQRASEESRMQAKQQLDATPKDQPRAFADYNRNKLAMDYPPGVTEESYTEGNKVIIRRVVVQGNRADEYSKVIAKWGTFYFKNGQSITEAIWSKETEG
jgi:hypothetical protein